jgi:hypothetical protein
MFPAHGAGFMIRPAVTAVNLPGPGGAQGSSQLLPDFVGRPAPDPLSDQLQPGEGRKGNAQLDVRPVKVLDDRLDSHGNGHAVVN